MNQIDFTEVICLSCDSSNKKREYYLIWPQLATRRLKFFAAVFITINCKAASSIDFKVKSKFNHV